jgi:hypothetical protein
MSRGCCFNSCRGMVEYVTGFRPELCVFTATELSQGPLQDLSGLFNLSHRHWGWTAARKTPSAAASCAARWEVGTCQVLERWQERW